VLRALRVLQQLQHILEKAVSQHRRYYKGVGFQGYVRDDTDRDTPVSRFRAMLKLQVTPDASTKSRSRTDPFLVSNCDTLRTKR